MINPAKSRIAAGRASVLDEEIFIAFLNPTIYIICTGYKIKAI
ncbi:MAG: hypothetical protein ABFD66_06290 [Smithella sp.]